MSSSSSQTIRQAPSPTLRRTNPVSSARLAPSPPQCPLSSPEKSQLNELEKMQSSSFDSAFQPEVKSSTTQPEVNTQLFEFKVTIPLFQSEVSMNQPEVITPVINQETKNTPTETQSDVKTLPETKQLSADTTDRNKAIKRTFSGTEDPIELFTSEQRQNGAKLFIQNKFNKELDKIINNLKIITEQPDKCDGITVIIPTLSDVIPLKYISTYIAIMYNLETTYKIIAEPIYSTMQREIYGTLYEIPKGSTVISFKSSIYNNIKYYRDISIERMKIYEQTD